MSVASARHVETQKKSAEWELWESFQSFPGKNFSKRQLGRPIHERTCTDCCSRMQGGIYQQPEKTISLLAALGLCERSEINSMCSLLR